jgi:hypothetical protein
LKHATGSALDKLGNFLEEIRTLGRLQERQRGIFYLKTEAFLHFHEDPAGLFADLREDGEFERYPVNSDADKKMLLSKIKGAIETCLD